MSNCETCGTELKGKQRKFCSNKCKCKASNPKHQNSTAQRDRAIRRKTKLILIMGGKCSVCGYDKNFAALVFHHLNPKTKSMSLDYRSLANNSWPIIMAEAEQCVLLCSNCHQETHHPECTINVNDVDIEPIEKLFSLANFCCDCGKQLYDSKATRCQECQHKDQEKVVWPSTEELLELLKTNSYCAVGRIFGVSDNAIRKRIKNHPA